MKGKILIVIGLLAALGGCAELPALLDDAVTVVQDVDAAAAAACADAQATAASLAKTSPGSSAATDAATVAADACK